MQDLFMSNVMYNIGNMHNICELQYVTIEKMKSLINMNRSEETAISFPFTKQTRTP